MVYQWFLCIFINFLINVQILYEFTLAFEVVFVTLTWEIQWKFYMSLGW